MLSDRKPPELSRRVAVVADAHLTGPGGPAAPLVEQLDALPSQGCDRLVLLGDLFQLWVGDERYGTPEIEAFAACLRRLRAWGIWIDYIEGNRDFYLADSPWADAFDRVTTEICFRVGKTRYLVLHGDGLDVRDWRYRLWRRLSKSAPVRAVVTRLPRRIARQLVEGTERTLAGTNLEHKRTIPREALETWARERLGEGHDRILLGHFHEGHRWVLPGGELRLVDAWFRSGAVEWLEEGV